MTNDVADLTALGDPARLSAVARTRLMDSEPEPVFDRIAALAASLLDTPVALVSVLDQERQYFKSAYGMPAGLREIPLAHSFCKYAVARGRPLVVDDARENPLFASNPAVLDGRILAYAGVPMVSRAGHVVGTLCATDRRPREWTEENVQLLATLSAAVVDAIELRQEGEEHRRTAERLRESEARMRMMLSQLPALTWSTDTGLRITSGEGLGVEADAVRGVEVGDVFSEDPSASEAVARHHRRALNGQSVRYEVRWKGRYYESWAEPLRSEEGRIVGVVGVAYDVTDQRQARQASAEARRRYQALVEHGSDLTALISTEGVITYESPSVQRILGYSIEEIIGRHFAELVHPDDLEETTGIFHELVATRGLVRSWRLRIRSADDTWRHVDAVARNVLDIPSLDGLVFTGRDITDEVEVQRQLVHSQRLDALGRLAGGVAHDFNNLLTVVNAHVEFLEQGLADEELMEEVEGIAEVADRAAQLTRQLLAFSGQQVSEPRVVDAGETVRRLDKMLRRLIGEDIRLLTRMEPALPPVCIDPGQLEQVIVNLVVNARDAMPYGGQLAIRLRRAAHAGRVLETGTLGSGDYLVIEVADQGVGMDADTRGRIFEPFFTTKGSRGTGLGLATSFGIVSEAGGVIEVDSAPGEGSRFRIHLPAATTRRTMDDEADVAYVRVGTERILLVEDDPQVRALTARALESGGYRVRAADCAARGVELARAHPFDLLVSDVILPDESGPELHALLCQELGADVPVLYVSGYSDRRLDSRDLGPTQRFLAKPFQRERLLAEVRAALDAAAGRAA